MLYNHCFHFPQNSSRPEKPKPKKSHLCTLMRNRLYFLLLLMAPVAFIAQQCANPVSPTGGPRDLDPPEVVESDPPNYSTGFADRDIHITFNEFVVLHQLQQQMLISPPLENQPEFRLRSRTLRVRFQEELKPETTYTLFFGDAIQDLTEGNPLSNYSFVFSTGQTLDSMSLSGSMHFAYDLEPAENAFAMLYLIDNDTLPLDSLPYLVKPYYVARVDENGNYTFNNLRNERFKLFGLDDMNGNFRYDMAGEAIAFLDTLITPAYFEPLHDSLFIADTLDISDTVLQMDEEALAEMVDDSLRLAAETERRLEKSYYELFMFKEVDSTQRLLRAELARRGLLRFAFRYPATLVEVEPLEPLPDTFNLLRSYNKHQDTLFWYFRQNILDTIQVRVKLDTLINDTLKLALTPRQSFRPGREAEAEGEGPGFLKFSPNIRNRQLQVETPLEFLFTDPVIRLNMRDSTRLITPEDTTYNSLSFERIDSIGLKYRLKQDFEAGGAYSVYIPDSVFMGLNTAWNDTIRLSFRVPDYSDYGNMKLNIQLPEDEIFIIQLLNARGHKVREKTIENKDVIRFRNLQAGKYQVKAIHDRNRNGRWDTGDYLKGIQAERVFIFPKEMEIRANWDFEEDWDIQEDF